jgi:Ca2+-transporting ATPase
LISKGKFFKTSEIWLITFQVVIIPSADFKRIGFEAALLSAGTLGAYGYGLWRYGMGAQANTLAFSSLTIGQLLHAFSCRSQTHSVLGATSLPANPSLSSPLVAPWRCSS